MKLPGGRLAICSSTDSWRGLRAAGQSMAISSTTTTMPPMESHLARSENSLLASYTKDKKKNHTKKTKMRTFQPKRMNWS